MRVQSSKRYCHISIVSGQACHEQQYTWITSGCLHSSFVELQKRGTKRTAGAGERPSALDSAFVHSFVSSMDRVCNGRQPGCGYCTVTEPTCNYRSRHTLDIDELLYKWWRTGMSHLRPCKRRASKLWAIDPCKRRAHRPGVCVCVCVCVYLV